MIIKANDPTLQSWVEVPAGSDFPIQNLPFGIFKTKYLSAVAGVAIGDYVLDLVYLHENGFLNGLDLPPGIFNQKYLNDFIGLGRLKTRGVRERISQILQADNEKLKANLAAREIALIPMREVQMLMPVRVSNYTDFYSSEQHARNLGGMFHPQNALLPNWKHLPVAYHGRASSLVVSGTPVIRPKGQIKQVDHDVPCFSATSKLDFELEVAFIVCTETKPGQRVPVLEAEQNIFGLVLLNDWSARDIQQWENVPLGPFAGKNFATTISPWIVTLDALEPFRTENPVQQPAVLPYLKYEGMGNFDINLEVAIQSEYGDEKIVCQTNFKQVYWNISQQLAHHTVNGCNIQVGDVMASGTISGTSADAYGSMIELTANGKTPLKLNDGSERKFLENGDTIIIRGYAQHGTVRVGFGDCRGKILPAID